MSRPQNAWRPLLLGAVLMLVLVGVAGAVPTAGPSALGIQRKLTIAAADFYPQSHGTQYWNAGVFLESYVDSTDVHFIAPVDFPTPRPVTVDKVQLHAYDNNSGGRITIRLYRPAPSNGIEAEMAYIDTGVAFVDPAGNPRTWQTTSISPNVKYQGHDTYLWATISDDDNLTLYGATIYYRVGT
jgi:hypothetical protein